MLVAGGRPPPGKDGLEKALVRLGFRGLGGERGAGGFSGFARLAAAADYSWLGFFFPFLWRFCCWMAY